MASIEDPIRQIKRIVWLQTSNIYMYKPCSTKYVPHGFTLLLCMYPTVFRNDEYVMESNILYNVYKNGRNRNVVRKEINNMSRYIN